MTILRGAFGLCALLVLAWLISEDRWRPSLRVVLGGLALQFGLALILLKFPPATAIFFSLNQAVAALQSATDAGTTFVFGYLGGGRPPFVETRPEASFILGFRAFPLVLVISALASLLLYLGVLQKIVGALAFALRHTLGVGGALGLGASVHIFVGMVEAPLLVRPYLKSMARGELFALMSCGMAGIAGTVMVIYASLLGPVIPDALGNILIASIISTPAALAVAAIMVPFAPNLKESGHLEIADPPTSAMEAIARGTNDGVGFLANIIAMLIVLVALVALVNMSLGLLPHQGDPFTLQRLFSFGFRPIMWLIGIPSAETEAAAALMSTKTVLNEFVAYVDLAHLPPEALSPRSRLIMTYALCGFANFGSLGIMIGGMTAMAPERKRDIVSLGFRSILSGTLATCMSGAVVGMLA
ncbi:nucleoside transporter C-terminal domain-containing protein [Methylocapsa polymorpha]|uniref:Nucleoside transporter C-terminal domain-containing protein n=1 Tax=Methylocapsa polymorpha TaxID=3080828 RepID=A0ABZ0HWZ6_9HYPH|nr:nucleoside transporter C-terminal domain-containing protein [Methylocapsa sp. RX1]